MLNYIQQASLTIRGGYHLLHTLVEVLSKSSGIESLEVIVGISRWVPVF